MAQYRANHASKLRILLAALDNAKQPNDMSAPNWRLHALTGNLTGQYAVTVNKNWRITFLFNDKNIELVDYLDYH